MNHVTKCFVQVMRANEFHQFVDELREKSIASKNSVRIPSQQTRVSGSLSAARLHLRHSCDLPLRETANQWQDSVGANEQLDQRLSGVHLVAHKFTQDEDGTRGDGLRDGVRGGDEKANLLCNQDSREEPPSGVRSSDLTERSLR